MDYSYGTRNKIRKKNGKPDLRRYPLGFTPDVEEPSATTEAAARIFASLEDETPVDLNGLPLTARGGGSNGGRIPSRQSSIARGFMASNFLDGENEEPGSEPQYESDLEPDEAIDEAPSSNAGFQPYPDEYGKAGMDLAENAMADRISIAREVQTQAKRNGVVVLVARDERIPDGSTTHYPEEVIVEVGTYSAEVIYPATNETKVINIPEDETLEHELFHALGEITGDVPSGTAKVEASGVIINADQARSINRTNEYRKAKGRPYLRTGADEIDAVLPEEQLEE